MQIIKIINRGSSHLLFALGATVIVIGMVTYGVTNFSNKDSIPVGRPIATTIKSAPAKAPSANKVTQPEAKTTNDVVSKPTSVKSGSPFATLPITPSVAPVSQAPANVVAPVPIPTPSPSPSVCPNAIHTPGGSDGAGGCWPYSGNTGVPTNITLSTYTGSCIFAIANTVLSGKQFNCDVVIRAPGVQIINSRINGIVVTQSDNATLTMTDSFVDGGAQETFPAVRAHDITLQRVEIINGQHSVSCYQNCTIENSWMHGQYLPATSSGHVNAFISNGGTGFTLRHNSAYCSAQATNFAGGCSGDISFFGDFGQIQNVLVDNNLFHASDQIAYCLYAGASATKPYPTPLNVNITNNIFQRGVTNKCAGFGPATYYLPGAGSSWVNNKYSDGVIISP